MVRDPKLQAAIDEIRAVSEADAAQREAARRDAPSVKLHEAGKLITAAAVQLTQSGDYRNGGAAFQLAGYLDGLLAAIEAQS